MLLEVAEVEVVSVIVGVTGIAVVEKGDDDVGRIIPVVAGTATVFVVGLKTVVDVMDVVVVGVVMVSVVIGVDIFSVVGTLEIVVAGMVVAAAVDAAPDSGIIVDGIVVGLVVVIDAVSVEGLVITVDAVDTGIVVEGAEEYVGVDDAVDGQSLLNTYCVHPDVL